MLGVSQTGWMFVAGLTFLVFFFLIMFMNKYAVVVALGTFPVAPGGRLRDRAVHPYLAY